jgi:hypothetical protein
VYIINYLFQEKYKNKRPPISEKPLHNQHKTTLTFLVTTPHPQHVLHRCFGLHLL